MTEKPVPESTEGSDYADRLIDLQAVWWKRLLPVQAPYRWNLRRLRPGFMLDVGCGLGRNLAHVGGQGVGVDHNPELVATARSRGLTAFTPDAFFKSPYATPGRFDSLLLAHLVEHMSRDEAVNLISTYLPYVKAEGRLLFVTPQERGFRADPTHVDFVDFDDLREISAELGATVERAYSFPFPRWAGRLFVYNEFNVVSRLAGGRSAALRPAESRDDLGEKAHPVSRATF